MLHLRSCIKMSPIDTTPEGFET